ncbi:MAG: ATP synthase subunit I [Desulfobulbaceae bacterium]
MKKNRVPENDPVRQGAEAGKTLLALVQRCNWLLLAILIGGAWYLYSGMVARSVLIGGLLANASFFLLRKDVDSFLANFSRSGLNWRAVKKLEKVKFFLKFYGRLAALAVILYFLVTGMRVDVIGLVVGLSSIMFSVIIVVLSRGSAILSTQGVKEA